MLIKEKPARACGSDQLLLSGAAGNRTRFSTRAFASELPVRYVSIWFSPTHYLRIRVRVLTPSRRITRCEPPVCSFRLRKSSRSSPWTNERRPILTSDSCSIPRRQGSPRVCPLSRHRIGPGDMTLEAKRFRHVAVAIPVFAVDGIVTASPRQQSVQPQQPDLAYHQTLICWRCR
jgi:hypothetical protein